MSLFTNVHLHPQFYPNFYKPLCKYCKDVRFYHKSHPHPHTHEHQSLPHHNCSYCHKKETLLGDGHPSTYSQYAYPQYSYYHHCDKCRDYHIPRWY